MKIRVRVHASARVPKSEQRGDELHIWVSAPPVDGKANEMVKGVLADLHHVPKSAVRLASGQTSKTKIFEIEDPRRLS
jgi:uncharacterized protein YggU (UPF0235/DUF167 family)